jgi:cytochrome c551/c552
MKIIYVFSFAVFLLFGNTCQANRQLANRNGCMNCHADTNYDAPTWAELATKYEKYQGQPDAARIQGERLREGTFFTRIKAHQKLTPTTATELMEWIIDGAK